MTVHVGSGPVSRAERGPSDPDDTTAPARAVALAAEARQSAMRRQWRHACGRREHGEGEGSRAAA